MTPAMRVAAVMAAGALAVPVIGQFEGLELVGYADPAPGAFPTACYGNRSAAVIGKRYTLQQCTELLAQDAIKHGIEIDRCLPAALPIEVRAAFTSAAFNIGTVAFCSSSMAKKSAAGDLRGACDALMRWVKAGNKVLPGLVRRRQAEQRLCLSGLAPTAKS